LPNYTGPINYVSSVNSQGDRDDIFLMIFRALSLLLWKKLVIVVTSDLFLLSTF